MTSPKLRHTALSLPQQRRLFPIRSILFADASASIMFDLLPGEIVLEILRVAAENMVATDRRSVVALAQTASFVYSAVAPVLYRRVVVTQENESGISFLLLNADTCALVRDLTVIWYNWTPEKEIVSNFTGLKSICGVDGRVQFILNHLHSDSKQSLRMIQSWGFELLDNVPAGVTHVCLYEEDRYRSPMLSGLFECIKQFPSITHLGLDMVLHTEHMFDLDNDTATYEAERRRFAQAVSHQLLDVVTAGGTRILQLAIRIGGIMADGAPWRAMIEALYERAGDLGIDQRIRFWRDQRRIEDFDDDVRASVEDAYNGYDVWTEATHVPALSNLD